MRIVFAVLVGIHGVIHLARTAKAFGWAAVQELCVPISPAGGVICLIVALLLAGAAVAFALGARWWWYLPVPGAVLAQALIGQV